MKRSVLILMMGLPRAGKSTWARATGLPVVSPDAIRLALHGQRFVALAEPFVWASAKLMVRALFAAGHTHVILDATNTTRARRDEWRSPDWHLYLQPIPTSREVCLARAQQKNDSEIVPVIERMAAALEPPGPDEDLLQIKEPELWSLAESAAALLLRLGDT